MSNQEDLLVGIVNNIKDLEIIRDQHWYRIPVISANKLLANIWPPKWIAFYQSGRIKNNPFMIRYINTFWTIRMVCR